jgi:hypothetical protein
MEKTRVGAIAVALLCVAAFGCGSDAPTQMPILIYQQDALQKNLSVGTSWVRECIACDSPSTPGCGQSPCGSEEYRANVSCSWEFGTEVDRVPIGTFNLVDYSGASISWEVDPMPYLQEVRLYCEASGYASRNINDFTDKPPVTVFFEFNFAWPAGSTTGVPGQELLDCAAPAGVGTVRNIEVRGRR